MAQRGTKSLCSLMDTQCEPLRARITGIKPICHPAPLLSVNKQVRPYMEVIHQISQGLPWTPPLGSVYHHEILTLVNEMHISQTTDRDITTAGYRSCAQDNLVML